MPIIRSSDQKNQTLVQFYSELASSENKISADLGNAMLKVIDLINDTFKETKIFGLTSHYHLTFLAKDPYRTGYYISVIADGIQFFHIEYKIPKNKQPWPNATVKGSTKSIDEFKNFIIIAMVESGGWSESEELKNLYKSIIR